MSERVETVVLARIPVYEDQELHLRRRNLEGFTPLLDLAQYNRQGGGYRLACPFPDDVRTVAALITALTERYHELVEEEGQ